MAASHIGTRVLLTAGAIAVAGYLMIIRGNTFTVGDRIKMGGVRGDVIALGFLRTRILEMGQPLDVREQEPPGMWVRARQYTGRIVTITNDKVFDEAIYNFTRDFPFIWEELTLSVSYSADWRRAEQLLLAAVHAARAFADESAPAAGAFEGKYNVELDRRDPRSPISRRRASAWRARRSKSSGCRRCGSRASRPRNRRVRRPRRADAQGRTTTGRVT